MALGDPARAGTGRAGTALAVAALASLAIPACGDGPEGELRGTAGDGRVPAGSATAASATDTEVTRDTVRDDAEEAGILQVQEEHAREWMRVPGVVGTGVGKCDGELCIKVYVSRVTPQVEEEIPRRVGGHPVRVEVTGRFRARETETADSAEASGGSDTSRAGEIPGSGSREPATGEDPPS